MLSLLSEVFFPCLFVRNNISDSLYVIGGHDGSQSLSSVEVLDHPNASWRMGPSLTMPRANTHAVVTAGNVIYVIGGFNGNQFLNSIELLETGDSFIKMETSSPFQKASAGEIGNKRAATSSWRRTSWTSWSTAR